MAYTCTRKCYFCGKTIMMVNNIGHCHMCNFVDDMRDQYGEGPDADRLMSFIEGHDLLQRVQAHERLIEEHLVLQNSELEDIRKKIFEAGDGSQEDWKIIIRAAGIELNNE